VSSQPDLSLPSQRHDCVITVRGPQGRDLAYLPNHCDVLTVGSAPEVLLPPGFGSWGYCSPNVCPSPSTIATSTKLWPGVPNLAGFGPFPVTAAQRFSCNQLLRRLPSPWSFCRRRRGWCASGLFFRAEALRARTSPHTLYLNTTARCIYTLTVLITLLSIHCPFLAHHRCSGVL